VPVAPGYHGDDQSQQRLIAEAERVGYPLIIKASAGGGGKGMQVVNGSAEVAAAIESAQRLARTAFGDDRLLMERYFPRARHVEVQVFADSHGGIVSLFDRDCSVQRRHQKIIEEAPAPGLRVEVRAAMAQAAIQSATAVGYVGAGTVEFLVDEAQHFYFMEMNTRLQVEHPVTEFITGIDLVEWQLNIAQGARLPKEQNEILSHGASVEARLYAEDPAHGYLPSVGRISHLHWPESAPGLRLDMGVDAGDEVSPFYDPMLGKLVAWGESRGAAIDKLHKALADIEIVGVTTNRALLISVLADEVFRRGGVATDFLGARHSLLSFGEPAADEVDAVLAGLWHATGRTEGDALWADTRGWRLAAPPRSSWVFGDRLVIIEASGADTYVARVGPAAHASAKARAGGKAHVSGTTAEVLAEYSLRLLARGDDSLQVELGGQIQQVHLVEVDQELHLFRGGRQVLLRLTRTEDALRVAAGAEEGSLLTPLPGTVVAVHVTVGQQVSRGAPLVTVEAMKMEHTLTAPYDGTVTRVAFGLAERVAAGAVLVELAPS
jgi:3-methylcrotonyl-CoA carboxylase alpha subunit